MMKVSGSRRSPPRPEAINIQQREHIFLGAPAVVFEEKKEESADNTPILETIKIDQLENQKIPSNEFVTSLCVPKLSSRGNVALRRARSDRQEWLRRIEEKNIRISELEAEIAILKSQNSAARNESTNGKEEDRLELGLLPEPNDQSSGPTRIEERHNVYGSKLFQNYWIGQAQEEESYSESIDGCLVPRSFVFSTNSSVTPDGHPRMCGQVTTESYFQGLYSQSIRVTGMGYTLVGLVNTDDEKQTLLDSSWYDPNECIEGREHSFPFMKLFLTTGTENMLTLVIDMVNREAKLFIITDFECRLDDHGTFQRIPREFGAQKPAHVWKMIPEESWIGIALQRASHSRREAYLLPHVHWDV